jgi:hypothetical protein
VETHWDRRVERVLKTTTPVRVFLRDAGIPDKWSSQVWAFVIEVMQARVVFSNWEKFRSIREYIALE